jgi:hypothetical protein
MKYVRAVRPIVTVAKAKMRFCDEPRKEEESKATYFSMLLVVTDASNLLIGLGMQSGMRWGGGGGGVGMGVCLPVSAKK